MSSLEIASASATRSDAAVREECATQNVALR
jgi:hypothetical protein